MGESDYEWTRRPIDAAVEHQRWPSRAAEFDTDRDDVIETTDTRPWQYDDPRPLRGYTLTSAGCTDDDCDHPIHRRYECVQCALGKVLGVTYNVHRYKQIKYACKACRSVVRHNPAGTPARYLVLFGENAADRWGTTP